MKKSKQKAEPSPLPRFIHRSGAVIVKCCASCVHKKHHTEFTRLCMAGHGIVKPSDPPCSHYAPCEFFLDGASVGMGRVKRKAYFQFFEDNYERVYDEIAAAGQPSVTQTIFRLREEFEQKTNISIYHNF